jgi:hypothetical protein
MDKCRYIKVRERTNMYQGQLADKLVPAHGYVSLCGQTCSGVVQVNVEVVHACQLVQLCIGCIVMLTVFLLAARLSANVSEVIHPLGKMIKAVECRQKLV